MEAVTAVHPSHMLVAATLPLRHQDALRGRIALLQKRLDPACLPFEWTKEFVRLQLLCFPEPVGCCSERILQYFRPYLGRVFQAMTALRAEAAAGLPAQATAAAGQGRWPARTTDGYVLPPKLHDVWPRVFRTLTAETARLGAELRELEGRLALVTRAARVDCMRCLLLHCFAENHVLAGRELLAFGLQGWDDLHAFMCKWVADCNLDDVPLENARVFRSVAVAMGLPGELPPLLRPIWVDSGKTAAAGYMMA